MEVCFSLDKTAKILGWQVNEGTWVPGGRVMLSYSLELNEINNPSAGNQRPNIRGRRGLYMKAPQSGVITKILAIKGSTIENGTPLYLLDTNKSCSHPIVSRGMCTECGIDLEKLDDKIQPTASVSMVHSVPDLRVSKEQAQILGKGDEQSLLKQTKLVLLVDLDQTLIHTTNDCVPNNLKDVFHFQLWGHGSVWYHTRLRPHTRNFLETMSTLYELHICTFGTRSYAHRIAHELDPDKRYFFDRILSRDECFSQNSKTANLKELFPRGDHMVCIIDDREDVWNFAPNLIHVKPYHFFRHTGDINAPPGLTKKDEDDKSGFEFKDDKTGENVKNIEEPGKSDPNESKIGQNVELTTKENDNESFTSIEQLDVKDVSNDLLLSDDDESDVDRKDVDASEGDMEESPDDEPVQPTESCGKVGIRATTIVNDKASEKLPSENGRTNLSSITKLVEATDVEASINPVKVKSTLNTDQEESLAVMDVKERGDVISESCSTDLGKVSPRIILNNDKSDEVEKDEKSLIPENISRVSEDNSERKDDAKEEGEFTDSSNTSSQQKIFSQSIPERAAVLEVDDEDDYLLYLKDILKAIHEAFYNLYKEKQSRGETDVPDIKHVIPYVRLKVLKGCSLVFSGVVPTEVPLIKSRPYAVAKMLGAQVNDRIIPLFKPGTSMTAELPTTHVIAARLGTAKVNEARRYKGIQIVTPNWLWCCAERWQRADERLFPLCKKSNVKRNPPAHCSSPELSLHHSKNELVDCISPIDSDIEVFSGKASNSKVQNPAARKERTPSGRFMDTINPLLTFSIDEIESMGHEVDDICNESESSSSDGSESKPKKERIARKKKPRISIETPVKISPNINSSSSDDSDSKNMDSSQGPCRVGKRKRPPKTETETEDEPLSAKFRRGEPLPSDLDCLNLAHASSDDDACGNDQEDEWMAEALEREFLNSNSQESQDGFSSRS